MKILLWVVVGVFLACGTVVTGLLAWAANWLAESGARVARGAETARDVIASLELPRWLAWLDPELVRPLQEFLAAAATGIVAASPWLAPLLGWVATALWIGWGLVALLVLGIAVALHRVAGSAQAPRPS